MVRSKSQRRDFCELIYFAITSDEASESNNVLLLEALREHAVADAIIAECLPAEVPAIHLARLQPAEMNPVNENFSARFRAEAMALQRQAAFTTTRIIV